MKKTIFYPIIILVLLVANLLFFYGSGFRGESNQNRRFLMAFVLEEIDQIRILNQYEVNLRNTPKGWMLNDSLRADHGFVSNLISILDRVEITRKIENWEGVTQGEIKLISGNDAITFKYAMNPTQTKTYFIYEGQVSEVSVPGYRDNVSQVFELHPDQWQDRLVYDGSWRTIQYLSVVNQIGDDFSLVFDKNFFLVNSQPVRDSAAVVDFLNQFADFQVNEIISKGRFSNFDSLIHTAPQAILQIDDINLEERLVFKIYHKLSEDHYHFVTLGEKMAVIDEKRVEMMLPSIRNFL